MQCAVGVFPDGSGSCAKGQGILKSPAHSDLWLGRT